MKKVVVLKATWCGPCKVYGPVVEEAKPEIEAKGYSVETVDVDDNMEFAQKHNVKGVPTTLVMDGDEVIKTLVGNQSKEKLLEVL